MPLLNIRQTRRAPPQHQPTNREAIHTSWHPHKLVDGAMSSPFLLGFILFFAALAVFLSRRRIRTWVSRIVGQAIEAANAPSLHIHIHDHGQSSSNESNAIPDSPMSPVFAPLSPPTQYPPTPNISDPSPMSRSVRIDVTPRRPSTVQITHIPGPSKVDDVRTTSRRGLTSITFYPDSPTGSSAPSTPALSECDSPQSDTTPLTPRMSFEEDVKVVPPSSPSPSVFSSLTTSLDAFRIQTAPFSVSGQTQAPKPTPSSVPDVSATTAPVARPPSPTMTISIHTTLPSHMISRARSTAPVPPNIVLTSVPWRPAQPEPPLSPPHMLAVPSALGRKQRPKRQARSPIPPPPYEPSKSTVDMWTQPTSTAAPNTAARRPTLKRPPPPPPKPIIPLDLEAVYPSKGIQAEVTPGPAFALRRPPPPPVKPVLPFDFGPVYVGENNEKYQVRRSQYDDREDEDEEVESPTSATMFFRALVEKGKREMRGLRKEREENGREERKWGRISIGAKMSALAMRAKKAIERELASEGEEEVVPLSPGSPVSRSGWPSNSVGTAKPQGVIMPLSASEVRKEREMVFVIGDEEDL